MDPAIRTNRLAIAAKCSAAFNLDPVLVAAVVEQESGWDPLAYRYEPGFYVKYIQPIMGSLTPTEARSRAYSWGAMQILGQVARELGFAEEEFTKLLVLETGIYWGCKKLSRCMAIHAGDVPSALLAYNGGSNPNYPGEVMARMPSYRPSLGL